MSRNKIILGLGILVAAMPFLGFPALWKTIFYVVVGLVLIVMAVVAHKKRIASNGIQEREVVTEVFVETNGKA